MTAIAATIVGAAAPLAALMLGAASPQAAPVASGEAACALAKARVAAQLRRTVSSIPACETIGADDIPQGFYVLALYGRCSETMCGSTLVGWYAVQKRTGGVFEWDVGERRLGPPIGECTRPRPSPRSARTTLWGGEGGC